MSDIKTLEKKYFLQTYRRLDVVFDRGEGCWLYDINNKRYLDFTSGIGVCSLGYKHHRLLNTLKHQAEKLWHTSCLVYTLPQVELAENLVSKLGFPAKVFFSNSGAEANEAAIKLTRFFAYKNNIDNPTIISMENSFHGRTLGCISATGKEKVKIGFEPLLSGFVFAPFNDSSKLEEFISDSTVGILIEVIQGEGGVIPAKREFIEKIVEIKRKYNLILIIDEVQTGIGRTGNWFAFQKFEILQPDIVTLSKGLGGGIPIGCTLVKDNLKEFLPEGTHASTFGGNPLACSIANEVIKIIEEEDILKRVASAGKYIQEKLGPLVEEGVIKELRGEGLIWGLQLNAKYAPDIVETCLHRGLWINATSDYVIRLLPPLIIKEEELNEGLNILISVLKEFYLKHR